MSKQKLYVSEIISDEKIPLYFKFDKFNIMECPTGSGKTVWAVRHLSEYQRKRGHHGRILMITNTHSNRDHLLFNEESHTQGYSQWVRERINKKIAIWQADDTKQIMVMTYAQLAVLLHFEHPFYWDFLDFVIFDEIHELPKSNNFIIQDNGGNDVKIDVRGIVINKILESLGKKTYLIGMTATPNAIYNHMPFMGRYHKVFTQAEILSLVSYKVGEYSPYGKFQNVLTQIPQGKKGLVYFDYITTMERAYKMLKTHGHKAEMIWSVNNEKHKHKMTDDRLNIVDVFVREQRIREDIDILIINAAYATGLKFDSHIDFVLAHSYVEDLRTQVKGRYSGDIDILFYPHKGVHDYLAIPREFLYRDLYADDKDLLVQTLNLKNENNRTVGWTTIKRIIESQNTYDIIEGKRNGNMRSEQIIEKL